MQIGRLIQIVFLLLRHENLTAKQLAGELCVFTRTIYRDINILSIAGIPITSQIELSNICFPLVNMLKLWNLLKSEIF